MISLLSLLSGRQGVACVIVVSSMQLAEIAMLDLVCVVFLSRDVPNHIFEKCIPYNIRYIYGIPCTNCRRILYGHTPKMTVISPVYAYGVFYRVYM